MVEVYRKSCDIVSHGKDEKSEHAEHYKTLSDYNQGTRECPSWVKTTRLTVLRTTLLVFLCC